MTSRFHHRGESGAAALLLVVSGVTVGLMVLLLWALPLAGASSQQAKTQSAADAAALAGADAVVGGIADNLKGLGSWNGSWAGLASLNGADRAAAYADENGATLIAYNGPSASNDWQVDARVRRTVDGTEYESSASAKLRLPSCSIEDDEEETPPPDDDENEEEDTPPDSKLRCNGMPAFTIIGGDLDLSLGWAAFVDALLGGSHARLTR
ncbi:hypothetical protein [Aeromicrobium sp.]|uniref:hypothetical protein n=1 Tax=Aeromicrobium sp. TaxID=1871063 RepID=UPI002FCBEDB2